MMHPIAESLHALGDGRFTVVTLEFPGHGATPLEHDNAFRLPNFVDAMSAAVSAMPSPPIVFGYSMGGYIALALAAREPLALAGVVTYGTKFEWTPESAARDASRLDPNVVAAKVPRFAEVLRARHARAGGWERNMRRTAALLRANAEAPLLSVDALRRVRIPVAIAVGSADDTVDADEASRAAGAMRDAQTVVIDGAVHPIERVPLTSIVDLVAALLQSIAR